MVILNPADTTHTITIIPRYSFEKVDITVRQEKSDVTVTFNSVDTVFENGYMTFLITLTVAERDTLEIEVKGGNDRIWIGKGFCTAQTDLENFKTNVITY